MVPHLIKLSENRSSAVRDLCKIFIAHVYHFFGQSAKALFKDASQRFVICYSTWKLGKSRLNKLVENKINRFSIHLTREFTAGLLMKTFDNFCYTNTN